MAIPAAKHKLKTERIPTYNPADFERVNYSRPAGRLGAAAIAFNTFEIHSIEAHKEGITFPLLPHRKTIHDFIYLTAGSMVRSKGLDCFECANHQLFFLPAHTITSTDYVSADARGYYCHFSDDIIPNKAVRSLPFFDVAAQPIISLSAEKRRQIAPLLDRLLHLKNIALAGLYIQVLLTEIQEEHAEEARPMHTSAQVITEKFKKALLQQVYTLQTVAGYAAQLHVSPNHLNKCVKTITNKTAQDWINDMIVLEAKVLLRQTHLSIAAIAAELTQQDVSDFSRFFKHKTGQKPSTYRQMD